MIRKPIRVSAAAVLAAVLSLWAGCDSGNRPEAEPAPRIVNIINFVRDIEPRPVGISADDLYEATFQEAELLRQHDLPGTFLLQYDAVIDPRYQQLMKEGLSEGSEIGAWWEITQPHVEAAGIEWRGIYPWDWHADVGFASGYTPEEREKLVDAYMAKFKEVFGYYPASVGSWFIDAHTLAYMADRYGIVASCNCRDQIGTDGYTLWGGYWNQAYYPSRLNAYMPAQNAEGQIPVPVFRMLGSDPINQYDSGLGEAVQGVETLEPVYTAGGGCPRWVDTHFRTITDGPCLAFQYTQVGQENSFAWPRIGPGLEYQVHAVDSLVRAGKATVQTLAESGRWFKEHFPVTPATAVTALEDPKAAGRKSVWFDSRFYRANLLQNGQKFGFRDIHLFDERFESDYLRRPGTSTQCFYTTLPLVDGFNWSTATDTAGLYLAAVDAQGRIVPVPTGAPEVSETAPGELTVSVPVPEGGLCKIVLTENAVRIGVPENSAYRFALSVAPDKTLPFVAVEPQRISARFRDFDYRVECTQGEIDGSQPGYICFVPDATGRLTLDMSVR